MGRRQTRILRLGRALKTAAPATLALLALGAAPAFAHTVPATCESPGAMNPVMAGQPEMSSNVEHLAWLHDEGLDMTAGGRRVGDRFYLTGVSHFSIYDISNPAEPKLLSRVDFACRFENEDVAVDGRSLIYSDFATEGALYVYDVRDGTNPELLAELPGAGTHTMTCVLDCRYLFGSYQAAGPAGPLTGGEVVDLADPAHPRVLGDWTADEVLPSRKVHDLTEIAPGLVLSASAPIQLMDVRTNPLKPTVLAHSPDPAKRWHSVEWPRQGLDRFVLATYETNATPRCEAGVGDFAVFDASRAAETGELEPAGTYLLTNENTEESSGNPTVNAGLGCSPHWFQVRPDWYDGGVVATGAYDHGTKFLRVDPMGEVSEVGHFRAPGTNASGAYWITCDIVYVVDYTRGFDVLRFNDPSADCEPDEVPAGGESPVGGDGPTAESRLERLNARVRARWRVRRRYTALRRITVRRFPIGSRVELRCRGRGCPRRRRELVVRDGRVNTRFRHWRLRRGARVVVRISRAGAVTQRVGWRIGASGRPHRLRLR